MEYNENSHGRMRATCSSRQRINAGHIGFWRKEIDLQAITLLEPVVIRRADHDLDDGEHRDRVHIGGEHVATSVPALLLLVPVELVRSGNRAHRFRSLT
jgi:hypothetical protein